MEKEFLEELRKNSSAFGLEIEAETGAKLAFYYRQVVESNTLLHLTAPSSVEDFVVRHILESLWLTHFYSVPQILLDVGAGAGLPSLPLLIHNSEWRGTLIESKPKKAEFLRRVIAEMSLGERAFVVEKQFAEADSPKSSDLVVCRALDKFTVHLKKLLKWADNSPKAFFGGESLRDELRKNFIEFDEKLLPLSEKRFVFLIKN